MSGINNLKLTTMFVYEVKTSNIQINDGIFSNGLFDTLEKAISICKQHLEAVRAINVTEDLEGKLKDFQGKPLKYTCSENKPAIYYNSYYGNYKCVVFIETRKVY